MTIYAQIHCKSDVNIKEVTRAVNDAIRMRPMSYQLFPSSSLSFSGDYACRSTYWSFASCNREVDRIQNISAGVYRIKVVKRLTVYCTIQPS